MRELFDARFNPDDKPMTHASARRRGAKPPTCWCRPSPTASMPRCSSKSGEQLKLIANFGNGVDNIDVATAVQRGITVTNTPGVLTEDTADMTMALILAVPRRLVEGSAVLTSDKDWAGWTPTWMLGHRIWGKRLGIIGMGRIGQAVARRARAFGLQIHYHNRRTVAPKIEEELDATYWESLDQMLARMDIVSVNCPHTPATYHLLSARRLKLLRPEAYIVNTSRGEVIDENALARLHRGGRHRRRRPRRVRARAGGQSEAGQARARRQGRAAAAHGLGHDRRPRRHGREGHHQHQDLHGRPPAAGSRAAVTCSDQHVRQIPDRRLVARQADCPGPKHNSASRTASSAHRPSARRPTRPSPKPTISRITSSAIIEPRMPGSAPRMPASAQAGTVPGGWRLPEIDNDRSDCACRRRASRARAWSSASRRRCRPRR